MHSGFVAIVDKPAPAMRCGNSAITARFQALSMPCQRAILGSVRPRPKQGLVLGSIMQTAIHGVSLFIQTKTPVPSRGHRLSNAAMTGSIFYQYSAATGL
jgi:hypothetical protein